MIPSDRLDKIAEEKTCNCRHSKCMKLYCECFSAGQECSKLCRCFDCHNQKDRENFKLIKPQSSMLGSKALPSQGAKASKGCSCRKSFCVKKYCECFQEGLLCNQSCKCIECQNNESATNRNMFLNLKNNASSTSNKQCSLYPIILTQNAQHLNTLINEGNCLDIEEKELQLDVAGMTQVAATGNTELLLDNFINILKKIEERSQKSEQLKKETLD